MDLRNKLRYKFAFGLVGCGIILEFAGVPANIISSGLIGAGIWGLFEEYSFQQSRRKRTLLTSSEEGK